MKQMRITRIEGTALPLRGNDIDTDRIMPARFLRVGHVRGARAAPVRGRAERVCWRRPRPTTASVRQSAIRGASILLVNRNFGCGSSREHAPQALQRWGIQAVVGESFSEIFFGNSLMIGLPCVTASPADVAGADGTRRARPDAGAADRSRGGHVRADGLRAPIALPPHVRDALVTGAWDTTGMLLERYEEVDAVAAKLPYIGGF